MQFLKLTPLLCGLLVAAGCRTDDPADATTPAPTAAVTPAATNQTETSTSTNTAPVPADPITAHAAPTPPSKPPGTLAPRVGDEIVVAGQFVHTGARVVLWLDAGGYDAYRVERRFAPIDQSSWIATQESGAGLDSPNRYELRNGRITGADRERVRGGGWDLPTLQRCVDQIVMHYDVSGTSRQCFKVLHDARCLSAHFMVDLDGTIYQTLDVKERARHASGVNDRSIGIEIANIGAYPTNATGPLAEWYQADTNGQTRITIPERFGDGGLRTTNFFAMPARPEAITNRVQGEMRVQYDFTPEQYTALAHLVATLCRVLPEIPCEVPRDAGGNVPMEKLPEEQLASFRGVLGHYHVTANKLDPGPAFQWDKVISDARELLGENAGVSSNGIVQTR